MTDWVNDFIRFSETAVASATRVTFAETAGEARSQGCGESGTRGCPERPGQSHSETTASEVSLQNIPGILLNLPEIREVAGVAEVTLLGEVGGPGPLDEERAAILEFMAGFPRDKAEELAKATAWNPH